MKIKIIKTLLLGIGLAALAAGCESYSDSSVYVSPDFPPAELVKQTSP